MSSVDAAPREWLGTNFRVSIAGRELGFAEVRGLGSETIAGSGGDLGESAYTPLILKRAVDGTRDLFAWRERIRGGERDLRRIVVELLDGPGGVPVQSWRVDGAWPRRWSGPVLNAVEGRVAVEEVEILYTGRVWLDNDDAGGR